MGRGGGHSGGGVLGEYVQQAKRWNQDHGSAPNLPRCHGDGGLFSKYSCDVQVKADENVTINVLQEFAKEMGVGQSCTDGHVPSTNMVFSTIAHSDVDNVFDRVYSLAPETYMCTISQGTGNSSNIYSLHWEQL
eukprot:CAMPEP_0119416980 /NCGR_PEP_ID=MMETSP1335-20130426/14569_1 /TAXON_ID=259385 /ORGANISM="Chrysoculter rhomboideus, Strain RCC1486" /LENGTH=133 /DNA_ID=CAMNT_0007442131 /DNA_START=219 /DNA_END=620 /DNA_ORIENTATION=-